MSDAASGKRDTIRLDGEVFELRFERIFAHPIDRVWTALTQPGMIAQWLAPAEIDPRPGGRIRLAFTTSDSVVDSVISEIDPPRVLEYRWVSNGDDRGVVRWELADLGIGPDPRLHGQGSRQLHGGLEVPPAAAGRCPG